MKNMVFFFGIFILSLLMVTGAYAQPQVAPLFNPNAPTLFSDNSADILINVDGSVSALGTPTVTVGDILVTVTGMNNIESTSIGSGTVWNEITAFSAAKVQSLFDIDFAPPGPDDSIGPQNIDLFQYVAVPLDAGDTAYFNWSTGQINLDGAGPPEFTFTPIPGTSNDGLFFGAVYEDAAQNYNRDGTIQAGIASATDGQVRLLLNVDPLEGDFISVVAPFDLGGFLTVPAATAIDNSNISLDGTIIFHSWPGVVFNNNSNITGGNGGFSSPSSASSWPVFDNLDFTISQAFCGDDFVDDVLGETCDPPGSIPITPPGNTNQCRNGGTPDQCTYCGDGIVQAGAGEDCDDGNTDSGDGCAADCTRERQVAVPTMNEWGMIVFMILAGLGSIYYLRRTRLKT